MKMLKQRTVHYITSNSYYIIYFKKASHGVRELTKECTPTGRNALAPRGPWSRRQKGSGIPYISAHTSLLSLIKAIFHLSAESLSVSG